MKGLASAPKGTLAKRKCSSLPFMLNKKRNASLSSSLIVICRNAFSRSASSMSVDIRALIMMFHSSGCRGGPVCMHSFTLLASGWGFALASNTIVTLVEVALSLTTGLWGM